MWYGDGGRASRQTTRANRVEDREPTDNSGRQCTPDCRHERMAYVVVRATITSWFFFLSDTVTVIDLVTSRTVFSVIYCDFTQSETSGLLVTLRAAFDREIERTKKIIKGNKETEKTKDICFPSIFVSIGFHHRFVFVIYGHIAYRARNLLTTCVRTHARFQRRTYTLSGLGAGVWGALQKSRMQPYRSPLTLVTIVARVPISWSLGSERVRPSAVGQQRLRPFVLCVIFPNVRATWSPFASWFSDENN